tara:strand:- start:510 stop:1703 length:1194 start_codon:yes stop_codon:yes gene_type:complete
MNELESYYQQNAGAVESMGFEARQGIASRTGALNVFEAKASAEEEETAEKEKEEEEGGGAGLAGGMLSKEGIQQVGKQVLGKAKSFAQDKLQSVVDNIKTKVEATRNQSVLDKDAPSTDSPVANQPDIVASELDTPQKLQSAQNTIASRVKNMDSETQKTIRTNVENDPNFNSNVATDDIAGRQQNIDSLNTHVQNASKDPNTRFQDDNLGADTAVEDTTQNLSAPTLGSSGTGVFTGTQAGSAPTSAGGTSTIVQNATENVADKAEGITQKGMDSLSEKVGVDFGDLSAKEVGSGLSSTLADSAVGSAVSKVSAGLEAFGGVADFLGPIGMIAGIGASIAGLVKGIEEKHEIKEKQAQITTMSNNINTTAGMSFGSIASTNLDTSQFRSGGLASNF